MLLNLLITELGLLANSYLSSVSILNKAKHRIVGADLGEFRGFKLLKLLPCNTKDVGGLVVITSVTHNSMTFEG